MVFPFMAAAALGGSIISGFSAYKGQKSANKTNISLARENRDFQEQMSNSAYQRAATDMEKAGLNRILAAKQGGATSPSGNVATVGSTMTGVAASAREVARQAADIEQIQTNTATAKAQLEKFIKFGSGPYADTLDAGVKSAKTAAKAFKSPSKKGHNPTKALGTKKTKQTWASPGNVQHRRDKFKKWWNQ